MPGLFDPKPEPGDRWRWALLAAVGFVVLGVLRSRRVLPFTLLAEGAIAFALLVVVVAGLVRLLR